MEENFALSMSKAIANAGLTEKTFADRMGDARDLKSLGLWLYLPVKTRKPRHF